MDRSMAEQVENFVMERFGDQRTITKREIVHLANDSNLPLEVKDAIRGLPEGEWKRYDLIGLIREQGQVGEPELHEHRPRR